MLSDRIAANKDKVRFHTPGHGELNADLVDCDVTELPYTDNLLSPVGDILRLEKKLASAYRAEAAFISTQGATFNVFQSVYARLNYGAFLVVGQAHVSVYNALRFFRAKAYHADELQSDKIPSDVKTVVVTVPDYFGRCRFSEGQNDTLKEKGIALIVDQAHGAHFAFSTKLPKSASEYADLVILSLHKTLPVLTGGSVLCCKELYADRCSFLRKTLHSTSPSFLTICSIEKALEEFTRFGEEYYDEIKQAVTRFKTLLRPPYSVLENDDFSRLAVVCPNGREASKELFNRGFVAEFADGQHTVFIVTRYNARHLEKLAEAFNSLPPLSAEPPVFFPSAKHDEPAPLLSGEWETVPLAKSLGRAVYGEVGFYPPGVPLLYGGDVITEEHLTVLTRYRENVFGLENDCIRVIK